jgi:hypothetical protein
MGALYLYTTWDKYFNFLCIPLNILFVLIYINENFLYKKLNDYSALNSLKNEIIMNLDKKISEIKKECKSEKKNTTRKLAEEFLNGTMLAIEYKISNNSMAVLETVTHYPMLKEAMKIIKENNYTIGGFDFQIEEGLVEKDVKSIKKYHLYYFSIFPLKILFWKKHLRNCKVILSLLKTPRIYRLKISFHGNTIRVYV